MVRLGCVVKLRRVTRRLREAWGDIVDLPSRIAHICAWLPLL